jgi:cytochrome b involved in lipid metabolism
MLKETKNYYKLKIPEIKSSSLNMDSNSNNKTETTENQTVLKNLTDGEKYQGETRKKVQLGKGYSLMDWIKKTRDTVDLAGTRGILRGITYDELIKHDKIDDCWMVIYGKILFSLSYFY